MERRLNLGMASPCARAKPPTEFQHRAARLFAGSFFRVFALEPRNRVQRPHADVFRSDVLDGDREELAGAEAGVRLLKRVVGRRLHDALELMGVGTLGRRRAALEIHGGQGVRKFLPFLNFDDNMADFFVDATKRLPKRLE